MVNSETVYIVGAGSVGGHIAMNRFLYNLNEKEIYFLDDDEKKVGKSFLGIKVIEKIDYLLAKDAPFDVIVGVAFPSVKCKIVKKLSLNPNINYPSMLARNAWISEGVTIGQGAIVYPNCSINYNSSIGEFCILNMNCVVGHDCTLGQYSSLAPGVNIGGRTLIGEEVEMGIGSATKQSIKIGNRAIVGGQAMVVKNVNSHETVAGVPAKRL